MILDFFFPENALGDGPKNSRIRAKPRNYLNPRYLELRTFFALNSHEFIQRYTKHAICINMFCRQSNFFFIWLAQSATISVFDDFFQSFFACLKYRWFLKIPGIFTRENNITGIEHGIKVRLILFDPISNKLLKLYSWDKKE